jgi:hypothetical protein
MLERGVFVICGKTAQPSTRKDTEHRIKIPNATFGISAFSCHHHISRSLHARDWRHFHERNTFYPRFGGQNEGGNLCSESRFKLQRSKNLSLFENGCSFFELPEPRAYNRCAHSEDPVLFYGVRAVRLQAIANVYSGANSQCDPSTALLSSVPLLDRPKQTGRIYRTATHSGQLGKLNARGSD